eukprot:SAG31_NODE_6350_length_2052_cov_1.145929_1_plen_578_part_01
MTPTIVQFQSRVVFSSMLGVAVKTISCAHCGRRQSNTAITCSSCGEQLAGSFAAASERMLGFDTAPAASAARADLGSLQQQTAHDGTTLFRRPGPMPARATTHLRSGPRSGDLSVGLLDHNPVSAGLNADDQAGGEDEDPNVPLPDFGLKAIGSLLRGDAAGAPGGATSVEFGAGKSHEPAAKTPREWALLALLVAYPLFMVTAPLHSPEVAAASRAVVLFYVCLGVVLGVPGVVCFRAICVVTHPTVIVERLAGATYTTKQGHLARLIDECGSVPQSTFAGLRALRRNLLIVGVVAAVPVVLMGMFFVMDNRFGHGIWVVVTIWGGLAVYFPLWIFVFFSWIFSVRLASSLTSAAMVARANQTSTLAKTAHKPPKDRTIFGSMRFPVPHEATQLQQALAKMGITLHIVRAQAGQDITDEVFEWIEHADTFLVFGTKDYGEDTGNPASSYAEAKYAQHQGKRVILIRMIPWEQEFEHLQARVMFGQNKLTLDWQLGASMPPMLCEQLVNAIDVGEDYGERSADGSQTTTTTTVAFDRAPKPRSSTGMIDDAQWRAVVETPALRLANTMLPTLSEGWGS